MPLAYTLELEILPQRESFRGRAHIRVRIERSSARVWLHGSRLRVKYVRALFGSASVEGRYREVAAGVARIDFPQPLPAGEAVLELDYEASFSDSRFGLYKVSSGADSYAFTQFESHYARQAFPCFDEPAFKTPFDVWLTVPDDQVAISNMPEVASEAAGPGLKRAHFAPSPPLPTYLVAFAVGPLDVASVPPIPASRVRPWPLPLRGVAARGKGELLRYALEHTPTFVAALEDYLGLPFPFPKLDLIAVPEFAYGAMENAGAITFREDGLLHCHDGRFRSGAQQSIGQGIGGANGDFSRPTRRALARQRAGANRAPSDSLSSGRLGRHTGTTLGDTRVHPLPDAKSSRRDVHVAVYPASDPCVRAARLSHLDNAKRRWCGLLPVGPRACRVGSPSPSGLPTAQSG
jgi:alanyl aminopeptidase